MALPRCERNLAVTLFAVWCFYFSISTAVAEHLFSSSRGSYISSSSSAGAWDLPIVEPSCDSSTPVCGEGGIDFESACDAIAAGVAILETGACRNQIKQQEQEHGQEHGQGQGQEQEQGHRRRQQREVLCNIRCFRADPVCGKNGITYWCGAPEAKCKGVEVAHTSFCDPKNGASGKKGTRATQSLFLVNLVWLAVAGFLVVAGFL